MKRKVADFLLIEEDELKGAFIALVIAITVSPIAYKIVFAPFGWWAL